MTSTRTSRKVAAAGHTEPPSDCSQRRPRPSRRNEMSENVQPRHAHDFDFYVGTWTIHNRRLRQALAGCTEWYEFEAVSEARPVLGGDGQLRRVRCAERGHLGANAAPVQPVVARVVAVLGEQSQAAPWAILRWAGSTATEASSTQTMSSRAVKSESSSSGRRSTSSLGALGTGLLGRRRRDMGDELDHRVDPDRISSPASASDGRANKNRRAARARRPSASRCVTTRSARCRTRRRWDPG